MTEENMDSPEEPMPDGNLDPASDSQAEEESSDASSRWQNPVAIFVGLLIVILIIAVVLVLGDGFGASSAETPTPEATNTPTPGSFITIEQPEEGAVLGIGELFTITGTGGGLFEGNVVVQALDQEGNVLAEEPTIIQAPDAGTGGAGPWTVALSVNTAPGTRGQIKAFSPSPEDGSEMASDSISVSYGEPVEAAINITEPADGVTLNSANPIPVKGTGRGLFEGNVIVRAVDTDGNVLAEQATVMDTTQPGGEGTWSVELTVTAPPGTQGAIRAFSPSPSGGEPDAQDSINVTFSEPIESSLRIDDPQNGAVLPVGSPFTVRGEAGGLVDGKVLVQAVDASNNLLAEAEATIDSPDASTGGQGPWSVELTVQVESGTPGQVIATGTTLVAGNPPLSALAEVTYGEADSGGGEGPGLDNQGWVLSALNNQELIENTQIAARFYEGNLSGFSGCNDYNADYQTDGNILTIGPAATTRKACETPEGVMDQENQYLGLLQSVRSYLVAENSLQLTDESGSVLLVYNAGVAGTIFTADGSAFPEGSQIQVQLADVSLADAPATVIAETSPANTGQIPVLFEVNYDINAIDDPNTYAVQVRVTNAEGNLIFINTTAYNVITQGNPAYVNVLVEPVQ